MSTRSIRMQLVLGVTLVHALLVAALGTDYVIRQKQFVHERARSRGLFEVGLLAASGFPPVLSNDLAATQQVLYAVSKNVTVKNAIITDLSGRILGHSDPAFVGKYLVDSVTKEVLRSTRFRPQVVREGSHSLFLAAPIIINGTPLGWAWLTDDFSMDLSHLESAIHTGLLYAFVAIAMGAFFALLLSSTINRQLRLLFEGARRFSENQLKKPIPIVTGNEIGIVTRAFNDAMRKVDQQQEDLREAVSARDEFFSVASHELKTPITSLKLRFHLLAKVIESVQRGERGQDLERSVELASKQVDRLVTLVNNLLDVSRARAGKLSFRPQQFNLSDAMTDLLEQCSPDFVAAGCSAQAEIEPNVVGSWDKIRIEQVVLNLVSNALKYAPGSPVEVRLHQEEENAIISIKDHGGGIPFSQQERIFDPFERILDCREVTGLGLGLYISKEIVAAHQGRIFLKSELGKGSEFKVVLPGTRA